MYNEREIWSTNRVVVWRNCYNDEQKKISSQIYLQISGTLFHGGVWVHLSMLNCITWWKQIAENKMLIKFTLWMSQIMLGVSIALRLREREWIFSEICFKRTPYQLETVLGQSFSPYVCKSNLRSPLPRRHLRGSPASSL